MPVLVPTLAPSPSDFSADVIHGRAFRGGKGMTHARQGGSVRAAAMPQFFPLQFAPGGGAAVVS